MTMAIQQIPMSSPDLSDADRQAVIDVINTPVLSMGGRILEFKQAFCQQTGRKHAIAVNSGTAGLHICVRAAGIGAGDLELMRRLLLLRPCFLPPRAASILNRCE